MRISVTGTTKPDLNGAMRAFVQAQQHLDGKIVHQVTTGGAHGIDCLFAFFALGVWPYAQHRVVLPAAPYDEASVRSLRETGKVIFEDAPRKPKRGAAYMARNDLLVASADFLLAFPETPREELRSGTWATIRRARAKHVPHHIFPLSEAELPS